MKSDLELICDLVRECGMFIKNADRSQLHVDAKNGHANFVTEYDKKVQEMLRVGLHGIMPDAHFVGEEGTTLAFSPKGKYFIVDPIDGTTNFIKDGRLHGLRRNALQLHQGLSLQLHLRSPGRRQCRGVWGRLQPLCGRNVLRATGPRRLLQRETAAGL